jgi:excisionase family DNA binding protein
MTKEFLNIDELSEYLSIKKSTLYSMVENGELPHYKIGRQLRFRRDDLEIWLESHRKNEINPEKRAKDILRGVRNRRIDVDKIVKEAVEEGKGSSYNLAHGKPDQIKGLGKEVYEDGSL